jgi:hypothetical protein
MKAIALAARRDSAAMRTIAVMTILFLPGTFLAVCLIYLLFSLDQISTMMHPPSGQKAANSLADNL